MRNENDLLQRRFPDETPGAPNLSRLLRQRWGTTNPNLRGPVQDPIAEG